MESAGGWEGALSVAHRADFPAERKRPRVGRLRAESWHLEKEKSAEKRRSDAHRAESGVSGDIKCGAFKIQAARDTHGELRNPDTRSKNTHVGFSFFFFVPNQSDEHTHRERSFGARCAQQSMSATADTERAVNSCVYSMSKVSFSCSSSC